MVVCGQVLGRLRAGRCRCWPHLAARALPLDATLAVLPCRGGEPFLRRLFEPLGYTVEATPHVLDEANPDGGSSRYFTVTLRGERRLSDLLRHLYVLIPLLDDDKHYFVGDDEVQRLIVRVGGWFPA